jgi:hypothetical protein
MRIGKSKVSCNVENTRMCDKLDLERLALLSEEKRAKITSICRKVQSDSESIINIKFSDFKRDGLTELDEELISIIKYINENKVRNWNKRTFYD